MKHLLITMVCILLLIIGNAQTKINDPNVKAQQDRMVATSWGNWLPEAKYFLGIQINPHYTLTWGVLAPSANRKYKKGSDIRPLSANGEQTQRMALNAQLLNTSNKYKIIADSVGKTATAEIAYNTGIVSSTDPLWLIYYKSELKGVTGYSLAETKADLSVAELASLQKNGALEWYDSEMSRLKERLEAACYTDMERSSRIMAYHRVLVEYRDVSEKWDNSIEASDNFISFNKGIGKALDDGCPFSDFGDWDTGTDSEIMKAVMLNLND